MSNERSRNSPAIQGAWWAQDADVLVQELDVDPEQGLTPEQMEQNRAHYGENTMRDMGPTSLWILLWESVKSPMMVLLLTVAVISLLLGQYREAGVMVFVVAMYVGIHLLNEARADRTMARLREVQTPEVAVLRQGEVTHIPRAEVVVGDLLPLRAGSRVAADGRLLSAVGFLVNESPLTGESAPVRKDHRADVPNDAPLAERPTAVFAGTTVVDGQGDLLVIAVGEATELGRVATLTREAGDEQTPLQREMSDLARTLAYVALSISLLIPLIGLLRGFDLQEMILTWLALTFLMVPGQPPIIIAMALALASLELARKQVVVRHLEAAETLGAVNILLSDKTGTMTQNRMTLEHFLPGEGTPIAVSEASGAQREALRDFLIHINHAIPEHAADPTDLAIQRAVTEREIDAAPWGELVNQVGFSRGGAYRALEYTRDGTQRAYLAGQPDDMINRATRIMTSEGVTGWDQASRERLQQDMLRLAKEGQRVTAYGYWEGRLGDKEPDKIVLIGIAGIRDPIRPEVEDAVVQLAGAGVRTVMVTGDVPETATTIAEQAGLDAERLITGRELESLDAAGYEDALDDYQVFARTTPEQKLKLVHACRRRQWVSAVTGDGVNDAPALRTADIGIAMGEAGTDVAQEAADLVLTDDNLARLPDGVAIGRKAYDNFRKGITYYLSAKAILLTIFIVPLLFGVPFPLAPIQIIFTELLMDLASSTIFVTEEAEPGLLKRKPRSLGRFLSWEVVRQIGRNMVGLTVVILMVYFGSFALGADTAGARTAAFSTWLLGHVVLAYNLKQTNRPLLEQGLFSNRFAAGWMAGMIALVLAMTFIPAVQRIMDTTGLTGIQWLMVVIGALLASSWIEARKWIRTA